MSEKQTPAVACVTKQLRCIFIHDFTGTLYFPFCYYTDLPTTTIGSEEDRMVVGLWDDEELDIIIEGCTTWFRLDETLSSLRKWEQMRMIYPLSYLLGTSHALSPLFTHGSIHPSLFSNFFTPADIRALPFTSTTYSNVFSCFPLRLWMNSAKLCGKGTISERRPCH